MLLCKKCKNVKHTNILSWVVNPLDIRVKEHRQANKTQGRSKANSPPRVAFCALFAVDSIEDQFRTATITIVFTILDRVGNKNAIGSQALKAEKTPLLHNY